MVVPATRRSTLSDHAFMVAGPWAWNSLPAAIRHNPSLAVFKRLLKTHLFTQSLCRLFLFIVWDRTSTTTRFFVQCP